MTIAEGPVTTQSADQELIANLLPLLRKCDERLMRLLVLIRQAPAIFAEHNRGEDERGGTEDPEDEAQPEVSDDDRDEEHYQGRDGRDGDFRRRKRVVGHAGLVDPIALGSKCKKRPFASLTWAN